MSFSKPPPSSAPVWAFEQHVDETPAPSAAPRTAKLVALVVVSAIALATSLFLLDRSGEERAEVPSNESVDAAIAEALSTTTIPGAIGPAISQFVLPSTVFIQIDSGNDLRSIGSGVVINDAGDVLTAFHVIDGAEEISVSFIDGTTTTAQVIETQPERDIAVLSVDTTPNVLVPAVLGGGVAIGSPVFALGSPLGLVGSVTEGIVSGLGRQVPISDGQSLEDLIQFDAAVNPGSSGGPLVDASGHVVGIVTALANPSGEDSFTGIGFAVPIDIAAAAAGGPSQ